MPTASAAELPAIVGAVQTVSQIANETFLERTADLRAQVQRSVGQAVIPTNVPAYAPIADRRLDGAFAQLVSKDRGVVAAPVPAPGPAPSNVRPSVFARAFGDIADQDGTGRTTAFGRNFGFRTDYRQETYGFQGGADVTITGLTSSQDGIILGAQGGYIDSNIDFKDSPTVTDVSGGTFGVFGSYFNGGFFADVLFKGELLDVDVNARQLQRSVDATNLGVVGSIGYKFDVAGETYIEPVVGFDYTRTDFERAFDAGGVLAGLQDSDVTRGRVGVRVGTAFTSGDMRIEPSLLTNVYHNFSDENSAVFTSGTTGLTLSDSLTRTYVEFQPTISVINLRTNLSGFVRAEARVGDDLLAGGGRVGIRYSF